LLAGVPVTKSQSFKVFHKQDIGNLALEYAQEAVFVFDTTGTFLYANPAGAEYFGVMIEEVIGKNLQDYLPSEQLNNEVKAINKVMEEKEPVSYKHPLFIKGKTLHFSTRKQPVLGDENQVVAVLSISTDITETVELEEKARLQEEKFRELLEATQNSVWEEDFSGVKKYLETLKAEGVTDLKEYFDKNPDALLHCADLIKVTDVNLAGMLVNGIDSKDELARFRVRDNLTQDGLLIFRDEIIALSEGEKVFESRMVTRHPTIGFVHSNMHVALWSGYEETWERVVVTFADVTLRERYRKELVESEERYRSLFEYASDSIFLINLENVQFVDANLNAQKMLGYSRDELFHMEPADLTVSQDISQVEELFEATLADNQGLFETVLVRKDRTQIPVEISSRIFELGSKQYVLSFVRDISERYQAEERIQRQLHRISVLREIDAIIASSLDLHISLGVILEYVLSELEIDAADILVYDPTIMMLDVIARRGFRAKVSSFSKRSLSSSFAGEAAMEGRQIFISSIDDAERKRILSSSEDEDFSSYMALPLIARGETKGVLELFHRSSLSKNEEWMGFAEALAGQAAIAIENIALFQNLKKANIDLSIAYDTTLEGWSKALEFFDHDTEGHTRRVTDLTMRLAAALGVPDVQLVHMRRGALLHDIGKMAIPGEILNKKGKLTDEETQIVQQHPQAAYKLLSPIPFLRPALDIPYCHHERWDSSGYPRGLKGEEIPLAARIFSVVDVWDALTSDRPYRKAWTRQETLDYILSESGRFFDPDVVSVFSQIVPTLNRESLL
jgi:PAS domain S-box-containing protein/putative nucleotidyltransferase with HDIG domain